MKKKLLCALLCAALLTPAALAVGSFPAVNTYTGFTDVSQDAWYTSAVKQCYETGLMNGTGKGNFSPQGTMTVAECAAIAARLREKFTGEPIPSATPPAGQTRLWYQDYVDYLTFNGVAVPEPTKAATRQEFFDLLSAVTPDSELAAINSITALPDTGDESVLAFYNAGILTGVDRYGTFHATGTLTRAEVAAMVARITDPSLRQSFIPQEKPTGSTPSPAPAGDAIVTVNGYGVSAATFQALLCNVAYSLDYQLYSNYGRRLDWSQTYTIGDPIPYVLNATTEMAVYRGLLELQAQAMGCTPDEVPQRLNPSPSAQDLQAYAAANDLLCAKHILCNDMDTAQAVLDGLEAVPTLDQFNALLQVFGQDPGMAQNPDGYLFTSGVMYEEFEAGTRALDIGAYSKEPVQTPRGYHIIWRLDPAGHPDLMAEFQENAVGELLSSQAQQAQVSVNEAALAAIDVPAVYNAFLSQIQAGQ